MSVRDGVISVTDTIGLLLDRRPEDYPLERVERFGQFFSWIMRPNDPQQTIAMGLMAVARVLRSELRSPSRSPELGSFTFEQAYDYHFSPQAVLMRALWPRGEFDTHSTFLLGWLRANTSCQIARFLLQDDLHPDQHGRKPSLNRAIHFVENDGYGVFEGFARQEKATSRKSIRDEWSASRRMAPFLLALDIVATEDLMPQGVTAVSPAYPSFLPTYQDLRRQGALSEFFQVALFVRDQLAEILGSVEAKVELPSFPDWLEPLPVSFEPFDATQQKLRSSYRAPTFA